MFFLAMLQDYQMAANGVARNGNDDVLVNVLTKDDLF